jgi:hypothetical protein
MAFNEDGKYESDANYWASQYMQGKSVLTDYTFEDVFRAFVAGWKAGQTVGITQGAS